MATQPGILAWRTSWTEEPGCLNFNFIFFFFFAFVNLRYKLSFSCQAFRKVCPLCKILGWTVLSQNQDHG